MLQYCKVEMGWLKRRLSGKPGWVAAFEAGRAAFVENQNMTRLLRCEQSFDKNEPLISFMFFLGA
jgi:hypothetical protein